MFLDFCSSVDVERDLLFITYSEFRTDLSPVHRRFPFCYIEHRLGEPLTEGALRISIQFQSCKFVDHQSGQA